MKIQTKTLHDTHRSIFSDIMTIIIHGSDVDVSGKLDRAHRLFWHRVAENIQKLEL